jgi:hypothetical protein
MKIILPDGLPFYFGGPSGQMTIEVERELFLAPGGTNGFRFWIVASVIDASIGKRAVLSGPFDKFESALHAAVYGFDVIQGQAERSFSELIQALQSAPGIIVED